MVSFRQLLQLLLQVVDFILIYLLLHLRVLGDLLVVVRLTLAGVVRLLAFTELAQLRLRAELVIVSGCARHHLKLLTVRPD